MFMILNRGWSLLAVAFVVVAASSILAASAQATPVTYQFTSGSIQLRAVNTTTNQTVLEEASPVTVPLGGTFVVFDADLGDYGTILDIQFIPDGSFDLDLDPVQAALDSITVDNAMLINAPGSPDATAEITSGGSFFLDTVMSGDVSGVFPDTSLFPSTHFSSLNSGASGSLAVNGATLQLGLFGVNLATFDTATNPGGNEIEVKADFFFISTVVPEPGTALLLGLGLAGLGVQSRKRGRK